MDNAIHYNSITKAWQYMLGKNFHWGLFKSDSDTLEVATTNLIDAMAASIDLSFDSKLLDVGCGIGEPSLYLHEIFGCEIQGFSNSEAVVDEANTRAHQHGVGAKVKFFVKDALNNGFEEDTFDFVWLMEMSHLIENKNSLIRESIRPLKKGGTIILCDLMFRRNFTAKEITLNKDKLRILDMSFGKAKIESFESYRKIFSTLGLEDVNFRDISREVIRTLYFWESNVRINYSEINIHISTDEIQNFLSSCEILREFYESGVLGYGIISGKKP
jgi:cyclopropane fatty-acyl-phospholipid synthase-like methyltransferase